MINGKVLIIDDDPDIRAILTVQFEGWGFEVITAENAGDGIALAKNVEPRLILIDINMPDISGFEATRKIRENPKTNSTPMLALTAHDTAGDRDEAHQAGCDAFIAKPIDASNLYQAVVKLVGELHA